MRVAVTGGSGKAGQAVVRDLLEHGYDVLNLDVVSSPLSPYLYADLTDFGQALEALTGVDAVVHLAAIIVERGPQTFENINHRGTRNVVAAMREAGVERLVHLSALGAGPDERFPYLLSKWRGEEAVRASGLSWTVLRPSVLHGEGCGFFRPIVWTLRWAPVYPMVARGETPFSPLWIEDLARCVGQCLRGEKPGATIDLGGPEVLSFSDIVHLVMEVLGKRRRSLPVPVWAARPFAFVQGLRRDPLVTNQQLDMVVLDNTASPDSVDRAFGFHPKRIRETDLRWLAKL